MPDRPNVLVFLTDQQRWDTTGLHGNPLGLTPNLDRAGASGTHLASSFTCQPVCGPARSALQTGMYPTTTGCFRNEIALPDDTPTLADHFGAAGYRTGYIGKWHLADPEITGAVPPSQRGGYGYWLAANVLELVSGPYDTVLWDGDGRERRLPGYRADALADAAIRFVGDHHAAEPDRPFYLFLSFLEPHHQNTAGDYPAPDGYRERYVDACTPPDLAALGGTAPQHLPGYYGMVKRLDEAYGRIMDALTSLGIAGDTIVAYTSDHGCHFRTRNAEYKRSPHDASIRVPTVLRGPGFDGGGRVTAPVTTVDLPPTLLDAAGLEVPASMQGRSVLPLLRGAPPGAWPSEAFVQISESQVGRAVRTPRWLYAVTAPEADGWSDPSAARYAEDCLYDLRADPDQLTNLIHSAAHREVAAALRERLIRRMVEAGEPEPAIDPAVERPSGQLRVTAEEAGE